MKIKWRNILIVIGVIVSVVLLVDFDRHMEEYNRLSSQLDAVHAEATAVIATQTALAGQVAYATLDAAVESWAYGNKMVRPGEHPVVLVAGGNPTPTPMPTSTSQAEVLPNWKIWWELFFGERP